MKARRICYLQRVKEMFYLQRLNHAKGGGLVMAVLCVLVNHRSRLDFKMALVGLMTETS